MIIASRCVWQDAKGRGTKRKAEHGPVGDDEDKDSPLGLVRARRGRTSRRQTDAGPLVLGGFAPLESLRFSVPTAPPAARAPAAQQRNRLCAALLRRRALPMPSAAAYAASALMDDAPELEEMSEAELQVLQGPNQPSSSTFPNHVSHYLPGWCTTFSSASPGLDLTGAERGGAAGASGSASAASSASSPGDRARRSVDGVSGAAAARRGGGGVQQARHAGGDRGK